MSETDTPNVGLTEQEVDAAFWREKEAGNCKSDRGGYYADGWRDGYRIGVAAERERANTAADATWALRTPSLWESPDERSIPALLAAIGQVLAALDTPREDQP